MNLKLVLFALISVINCSLYAQASTHSHNDGDKNHPGKNIKKAQVLLENKGQWPESVLFRTNMPGGKLWVQQHKFIYHLQDYSSMHKAHAMSTPGFTSEEIKETLVHLNFVGSNQVTKIKKQGKSKEYYNFFKGNDKSKWASDVHGYEDVILENFYTNIDLHLTGDGEETKYEFIVHSNSDPSIIRLNYAGQSKLVIDEKGNLIVVTSLGNIVEYKPYAYQIINGQKSEVSCNFKIIDSDVIFDLGDYNKNQELIIDPTLVFATYDGANSDNFGMTATYGNDGTAYSGGTVYGNDYPNPDPLAYDINSNFTVLNGSYGITDVFVSKYSADGTQMIWGTFLGGGNNTQGTETVHSMICDAQDNLYIFGATSSNDFPTTSGAFDMSFNGGNTTYNTNFYYNGVYFQNLGTDIYVAKFSANGHNLLGSTYVGGNGNDGVNYEQTNLTYNSTASYVGLNSNYGDQSRGEIMLDANNNILVASCSRSTNFPTVTPFQAAFGGIQDGVIFKLSANFNSLLFSSYYGGSSRDACYSVKVDDFQNVIFAGGTQSNNLSGITGTWQTTYGGGTADGFVVKLPPAGNIISSATYVGKGGYDQVFFVELDRNNNIYVLGQSVGSAGNGYMPITNAAYFNGNSSNFIVKFNTALTSILNSTRFGNGSTAIHMSPAAFLVDNCGNIYVSGWGANILQSTPLSGMPVTSDAFQATPPNGFDFYLFVLKGNFNSLLYGSYIGGNQAQEHVDGGTSRFDKNGIVYQSVCGGCGMFSDFPTTAASGTAAPWSATNNSNNCNNIIYKFSTGLIPVADFLPDQTAGCADFSVTFDNFSTDDDTYLWDFGNGNLDSTTFEPTIIYTNPGNYTVNLYVTDSVCQLTDTAEINITVYPSIILNIDSTINLCSTTPITLTADTDGTANTFIWSTSPTFSTALNSPADSTISVSSAGTYYIQVSNPQCSKIDTVVVTVQPPPNVSLSVTGNSGCAPFTSSFQVNTFNTDSLIWNFGGQGTLTTSSSATSQSFEFLNPGSYLVTVTGFNECPNQAQSSVSVNILEPISIYTPSPIFICNNDPYTLSANITGLPTNVIWSDLPDFSNPLNSGPSDYDIVVSTSGTYYIQAFNSLCGDTASSTITFNSPSQASFEPSDTSACGLLTVSFNNTSVQTQSFLWDFGNGQVDSVNFEPTVTYNSPGQYQVSLSIYDPTCPAADTAYFTLTVEPEIQVTLNDLVSLCDTVPITASPIVTNGTATSFQWSSNNNFSDTLNSNLSVADLTLSIPLAGYYYLNLSNGECSTIDSFLVEYITLDIDLSANDSICSGENSTVTAINLVPTVNLNYAWTPSSIVISSSANEAIVNPTFSQYVYVSASGNGCSVQDSIFINVATLDPALVIASASQYIVTPGSTVTLFGSPSGLDSYSWTPSNGLSDPTMQQTNATVNENTIYTLTVSEGPCTRSDTTEVKVYEIICEDPYVFIPNAFSPNGDNENDVLYVRGIYIEKMIFRIFDRWGEMVFESTDPTIGWDGTFRERKLDPDVYDFYLDVTCIGGLKSITKGNITLMK